MDDRLTHIGNYRIERQLTHDERRVVYQGWQIALTRPVQITHLTPQAAADAAFVERWKAAARDMKDPGHPGMPRILEGQFIGERLYLIESYIVGDTLADQVKVTRDLRAGIRLLYGLADVLAYAHRRGWAYGGITPEDVRIGADGNAYLIDLPWHAASRARGDAAAQRADGQNLGLLFLAIMAPACGAAPEPAAGQSRNTEELAAWLAPASAAELELARALAPVVARALDGAYPDCSVLVEALRPLVQGVRPTPSAQPRAIAQTMVDTPPAGQPLPPPTPGTWTPAPAPQSQWAAPVAPPAPPYAAPAGAATARPPDIKKIAGIAAVVVLVSAILGVVLCRLEVLPFCVACDNELIAEFLGAGTGYRTTGAWADAFRELDAGQAECDACRKKPADCSQMTPLWLEAKCHVDSQRLVAEATTLLDEGQACTAVQKLEEAQKLGCETKAVDTLLVTGTAGRAGAYVPCSVSLLEEAGRQTDPAARETILSQVHGYLARALGLKAADPTINQLFARAERYATVRKGLAAKDWPAAAAALQQLELVAENGQYGGQSLQELWFAVHFGQAEAAAQSGQWCEAWTAYQAAEAIGQTLKQKEDAGKGMKDTYAQCSSGWTPTPTPAPTPTVTPTPTATPQPIAHASGEANVRKGPYTGYAIVVKTKNGEAMNVICTAALSDGAWYQVKTAAGVTGWVRSDVVRLTGAPTACPPSSIPGPPPPVALCWSAQALPPSNNASNLFAIRMRTQDVNGVAIPRVRTSISHESTNLSWVDETGPNGEALRVGINQWFVNWHVCIYSTKVCADTNAIKEYQRADIIFTRRPCQ